MCTGSPVWVLECRHSYEHKGVRLVKWCAFKSHFDTHDDLALESSLSAWVWATTTLLNSTLFVKCTSLMNFL